MTQRARGNRAAMVQRRHARNRLIAIVLVVMVLAGFAATLVLSKTEDKPPATNPQKARIESYITAVKPLAFRGGQIVQENVKPRLGDLTEGKVTRQQFEREALSWRRQFVQLRSQFAAVPHSASLEVVAAAYDKALNGYIAAIDRFILSSRIAAKPPREAGLEKGRQLAQAADKLYDDAKTALKSAATAAGVDPNLVP